MAAARAEVLTLQPDINAQLPNEKYELSSFTEAFDRGPDLGRVGRRDLRSAV